jgi:N-acetyl-anhydromuramyl-L-alanine amidase AmpD
LNITNYSSPNYGSRCGHVPDVIVCHITCGTFEGAVETLCSKEGGLSSHFVLGRDGQVSQLVDIRNEAYCNGTRSTPGYEYVGRATAALVKSRKVNANLYTVSIECEGFDSTHGILTDIQFATLVQLIQHIKQQVKIYYGIDIPFDRQHIIGHCEIAPREKPDCPGKDFPYAKLLAALGTLPMLTQIDEPTGTISGAFVVRGWALNSKDIERVDIYADGKHGLGSVKVFTARPDVAKVHGSYPSAENCGYSLTIPAGTLKVGKHAIGVAGIGKDGSVKWTTVNITVK